MHQSFPRESRPIPTIQNLLPRTGARLLATVAVAVPHPGKPSIRTRMPGFSGRKERMPQPRGLTRSVWQFSAKVICGSMLVTRNGICARTRVPCRLWMRDSTSSVYAAQGCKNPEITSISHAGKNQSNCVQLAYGTRKQQKSPQSHRAKSTGKQLGVLEYSR